MEEKTKCDQKGSCWLKIKEHGKEYCSHPVTVSDGWFCWAELRRLKEETYHGNNIQRLEV